MVKIDRSLGRVGEESIMDGERFSRSFEELRNDLRGSIGRFMPCLSIIHDGRDLWKCSRQYSLRIDDHKGG